MNMIEKEMKMNDVFNFYFLKLLLINRKSKWQKIKENELKMSSQRVISSFLHIDDSTYIHWYAFKIKDFFFILQDLQDWNLIFFIGVKLEL